MRKHALACAVLAAALLPCAASAQRQDAAPAPQQEAEYQAALRALNEGRIEEASALLQRVVEEEPRHAGAWLDLAISQCELGNAAEAERLFTRFEQRFPVSPGIAETIARFRATGCGKQEPAARRDAVWLLSAARGRDDNVNQGASDPRFSIGSGSKVTEYELDPSFLPKADNYKQLTASWLRPLGKDDTSLIAQAYSRWNDRIHAQDTASVLAAIERGWRAGGWRLRGTAALGLVTLDRDLYQRQQQVQLRATPPQGRLQKLVPDAEFTLYGNLSHVEYPTRSAYDGTTLELGGIGTYRARRSVTQATLTRLHDDSRDGRPGGDREGWFGSLQWYAEPLPRLGLEAGLNYQRWRSDRLYSPGLIETRRLQETTTLRGAAQWQLRPHATVVLEWRGTFNHENISLFQYNSRALQLSLRCDNF